MMMRLAIAAGLALATLTTAAVSRAETEPLKTQSWTFDGVFGTFDRKQLQRGLKVYTTICAGCHSMHQIYYRNLVDIGLTTAEAKEVAAAKEVDDIGDDGQPKKRKAELKDRFVSPFPNVQAAATANNNKAPPDLSLIVKARDGGADHVYSILTGYAEPPADWKDEEGKPRKLETGQNYNKFFPGNVIAMPPPLAADGAVEYGKDDPKPTIDQMAKDVAAFLAWASDPTMEQRKRTGIKVILFLLLFTGVSFAVYRRVWRDVH